MLWTAVQCWVLALFLQDVKRSKREKISFVDTTVISARAHVLFATMEKIFPGKTGLERDPGWFTCIPAGCGADRGVLNCCVQKVWTRWQKVSQLLHWPKQMKKEWTCTVKTGLRSGGISVIFQSDCSLIEARGLPHINTFSDQVLETKLLPRYRVQIWHFPVMGQLPTALHDVHQVIPTHLVKTPT